MTRDRRGASRRESRDCARMDLDRARQSPVLPRCRCTCARFLLWVGSQCPTLFPSSLILVVTSPGRITPVDIRMPRLTWCAVVLVAGCAAIACKDDDEQTLPPA